MSRRRPRKTQESRNGPEQLPLVAPVKPRRQLDPDQAAKLAIARRAKRSARSDYVRLMLTLGRRRALAERLNAKAIRDGKNLEAVVIELLEGGSK